MLHIVISVVVFIFAFTIGWAVSIGELERIKLAVADMGAATYDLKTGKFALNEKWIDGVLYLKCEK
tara:strand:- start:987 stop:1184 length:198 start_codon:yes stop_codon:yes gene_type:complete